MEGSNITKKRIKHKGVIWCKDHWPQQLNFDTNCVTNKLREKERRRGRGGRATGTIETQEIAMEGSNIKKKHIKHKGTICPFSHSQDTKQAFTNYGTQRNLISSTKEQFLSMKINTNNNFNNDSPANTTKPKSVLSFNPYILKSFF